MPNDLSFYVACGIILLVIYKAVGQPIVNRFRAIDDVPEEATPPARPRRSPPAMRSRRSKHLNAVNPRSAHQEARSSDVQHSTFVDESSSSPSTMKIGGQFTLSFEEFTQLTRALTLKAQGSTKQEALESAFSCKKGAGEAWQRASQLYDLATRQGAKQ